jgi:isoleucyl-tRNA synthetase
VHLTDWPAPDEVPAAPDLVAAMDAVREVCSAASSVRKAEGIPNRQPLATLTVASPDVDALAPFIGLIADEANVKHVELTTETAVERVLKLKPSVLGPRVGADIQKMLRAAKEGGYELTDDGVVVGDRTLQPDEYDLILQGTGPGTRVVPNTDTVVVLDLTLTPELEAEGLARFVVRQVNELRKRDGLQVTDRIHLLIDVGHHAEVREHLEPHIDFIKDETLANRLTWQPLNDAHRVELPDRRAIHITLHREDT